MSVFLEQKNLISSKLCLNLIPMRRSIDKNATPFIVLKRAGSPITLKRREIVGLPMGSIVLKPFTFNLNLLPWRPLSIVWSISSLQDRLLNEMKG